MNNKGFNWFFPIVVIGILMFLFQPSILGKNNTKSINEDKFFNLVAEGKIQEILIYKDTEKADVFLTKEAKNTSVEKSKQNFSPLEAFNTNKTPDYTLTFGDLGLFQKKFDDIRASNPNIKTELDFGKENNPFTDLLIQFSIYGVIMFLVITSFSEEWEQALVVAVVCSLSVSLVQKFLERKTNYK